MIKKILLFFFVISVSFIYPQSLPFPKNSQLYTEFISYKYAKYLKKPLVSSGYIAMDGEKFIFKQNKPVAIEIKKIEDKITLQKENSQPIELDSSSGSNNEIIFLFGNPDMVKDKYKVEKKEAADEDIYTVIPIKKEKIVLIIVIAKEDKVKKMDIKFLDASNLIYEFKNTVTGVKPNEEFFK